MSVVVQDYPKDRFEVVVVNNGSWDETESHLRQFVQRIGGRLRIKYLREDRRGLVFSRHSGAANCDGEIVIFGDDDMIFEKNWIAAIVGVYREHPEVGAVGTRIRIRWDEEPETWVRRYEPVLGMLDYGEETVIRSGLFINGGSFSIRRNVLMQVGGFNPGQRGAYIVGDSETGLCRKLARSGIPVGWTGATTAWHVQEARKNGTLVDIKRRFRNNGICDAYYATFYDLKRHRVARDLMEKSRRLVGTAVRTIQRGGGGRCGHRLELEVAYYAYYVKYLLLYRVSRRIRDEIRSRDWEFGSCYKAPPVEFSFPGGEGGARE